MYNRCFYFIFLRYYITIKNIYCILLSTKTAAKLKICSHFLRLYITIIAQKNLIHFGIGFFVFLFPCVIFSVVNYTRSETNKRFTLLFAFLFVYVLFKHINHLPFLKFLSTLRKGRQCSFFPYLYI